jgi:hypothetical protein
MTDKNNEDEYKCGCGLKVSMKNKDVHDYYCEAAKIFANYGYYEDKKK